ncbi:MAG TPA: DNA polymerase III subunit delta [Gaiellaceae bacterium]|nr:DNA polymerase III subunit delta [Gaiellaceae bacterium]
MPEPELKPVYLIAGTDRPKVERAVERLRAHFDNEAVERLFASEASGEEVVASCNALGLFGGGRRLVLVDSVDRWKAADVKAVADYLRSPTPETVLALVAHELKKDAPIAKACAKEGDVLIYDTPRRNLSAWVAEQFARAGAKADPEACRMLVDLVGDDLIDLSSEVEKLATWADGDEIRESDVETLVAPRAETPPWTLTDAWARRDPAGVLAACERVLTSGEKTASALVWSVADHVGLVRACAAFARDGVPVAEAAKRLRKKEYPVRKAYGQAEAFSDAELDVAVTRLAALDVAVKGGSRLPDDLELERTLVEITRPRRTAARAG